MDIRDIKRFILIELMVFFCMIVVFAGGLKLNMRSRQKHIIPTLARVDLVKYVYNAKRTYTWKELNRPITSICMDSMNQTLIKLKLKHKFPF